MFGKNPVRKAEHELDGQQLWVQDVFGTLQGEGPFAGQSSVFIRLAGCNLRCHFCDTDFESSTWTPSLPELLERVTKEKEKVPRAQLIVLTGGEPMRQNIVPLCFALLRRGFTVQIETAGTLWPTDMANLMRRSKGRMVLVCSPKTPVIHPRVRAYCRVYKYICKAGDLSDKDGLPAMSTQMIGMPAILARPSAGAVVYVNPMDEVDPVLNKANLTAAADSAMWFGHRLGLQIHKIAMLP